MKLIKLYTYQSLITEISDELVTFAAFLDIPTDINMQDDHIFILDNVGGCSLSSYHFRQDSDVLVPTKVFCELLMDIKAAMTVIDAFNRQGYTYH